MINFTSLVKTIFLLYISKLMYSRNGKEITNYFGVSAETNGGTINDLFNPNDNTEYNSDEYARLKDEISLEPKEAELFFQKVKKQLLKQLDRIQEKGSAIIPETTFQKILSNGGHLPESIIRKVQKHGILIVRNTIPPREALEMMSDLIKYMYTNNIYPINNTSQTVFEIYWSKAQMQARQHPNMIQVQKSLLKDLWHTNEENAVDIDLSNPVMYADRLRIRNPGDTSFHIPPHLDGGSIERWSDVTYRHVYRRILEDLDLEGYDPFEADYRIEAQMNKLGHSNGCTAFRAFQGWLSLSNSQPGTGTLKVFPLLKETTAYIMIRPFLSDVSKNEMPGCVPSKTFHVSQKWHPDIYNELISIPRIFPGDTVWWHPDLIHSVENTHQGNEANSVLYIPVAPDCSMNRIYQRKMRHSFILGKTPPDFPENNNEVGFKDRATIEDLSNLGRRAMGWPPESNLKSESSRKKCTNENDEL